MSQVAVVERMRQLVETLDGIRRAYSTASTGDRRVPPALNMIPCAVIYPGATKEFILGDGEKRHTYEVVVEVFGLSGDPGVAAANVAPMPDAVMDLFEDNVALGGVCNSCIFLRTEGVKTLNFGGHDYSGFQLYFEVSEQAVASPAIGDPPA